MSSVSFQLLAQKAVTRLNRSREAMGDTLERLATGKRINRASDDPSGMVAAVNFKGRLVTIEKQIMALDRERLWLSASDGAYAAVGDLLLGITGDVVAASNTGGLGDEEREAIARNASDVVTTIERMLQTSSFNDERLFNFGLRGLGSTTVEVDDGAGGTTERQVTLQNLGELLRGDRAEREAAQTLIEQASDTINRRRASMGARIKNGIEPEIRVLQKEFEEVSGAKSLIEDADYAEEAGNLVRQQILEQAAIFTVQLAQQSAEAVLDLLTPLNRAN
ncbi:MAG: flagellin [Planctomycetota bacterium]